MIWSTAALLIGFCLDLLLGEVQRSTHPVALMGREIAFLERRLRRLFPKTERGEILAGALLWLIPAISALLVPWLILRACRGISPWFGLGLESIMCWQILAVKALRTESMKVYAALRENDLEKARHAVSMIVGRDTKALDEKGIIKAAIETVAENSSDGVIAPLVFMALGGAPLGFFYKAVNTMDSMLGYVDPPYKNIGLVPARMDDLMNFIPARLSAFFMLLAGGMLGLDLKGGLRIFLRDRKKHASPNSAQTESVCAGLLGVQLAGDAWYHGVLHRKEFIGDATREAEAGDIPLVCRVMVLMSVLALLAITLIKLIFIL